MKTLLISFITLLFLTGVKPKEMPIVKVKAFDRLDSYEIRENRNRADLSCSYLQYAVGVNELNKAIVKE